MKVQFVIVVLVATLSCPIVHGANKIFLSTSASMFGDTIFTCQPFYINIGIQNDITWKGMSLGFRIFTPDSAVWNWLSFPSGYGPHKYVTINSSSRMNNPASVWDQGFLVIEQNVSTVTEDTILIGGAADVGGLSPGPAQDMIYLMLYMRKPLSDNLLTLCMDSVKVGASGDFVFADANGNSLPPEISWSQGGICWPVQQCRCGSVYITGIGQLTPFHCFPGSAIMTAVCTVGDPINWGYELISGQGTVSLAQAQGTTNTITYTPAPDELSDTAKIVVKVASTYFPLTYQCFPHQWDTITCIIHTIGDANNDNGINVGDAVYVINYVFKSGPAPAAWKAGDANCDGLVNVGDAVRLINHVFKGAPSPVNACCQK
jgi:hypothetical protein